MNAEREEGLSTATMQLYAVVNPAGGELLTCRSPWLRGYSAKGNLS